MPWPKRNRALAGFPQLARCSTARFDDLVVDHADRSPREYIEVTHERIRIEDG